MRAVRRGVGGGSGRVGAGEAGGTGGRDGWLRRSPEVASGSCGPPVPSIVARTWTDPGAMVKREGGCHPVCATYTHSNRLSGFPTQIPTCSHLLPLSPTHPTERSHLLPPTPLDTFLMWIRSLFLCGSTRANF